MKKKAEEDTWKKISKEQQTRLLKLNDAAALLHAADTITHSERTKILNRLCKLRDKLAKDNLHCLLERKVNESLQVHVAQSGNSNPDLCRRYGSLNRNPTG